MDGQVKVAGALNPDEGKGVGMREYRIRFANTPRYLDYIIDAKDAHDARVMGEVWAKRWGNGKIESITDVTKEEKYGNLQRSRMS